MKQESPAVWVCPQCGALNESENCPRCGLSRREIAAAPPCFKPEGKSHLFITRMILGAGCLGAVALLVCGGIMLSGTPKGLFEGSMIIAAGLIVLFVALFSKAVMDTLRSIDRSLKEMNGMFK